MGQALSILASSIEDTSSEYSTCKCCLYIRDNRWHACDNLTVPVFVFPVADAVELTYTYEEGENPEDFFLPYVWENTVSNEDSMFMKPVSLAVHEMPDI